MDAVGHAFTNLTLNWSVSGGGSLDHAVTSPEGGNDATLNGWTVGTQDGLESITVSPVANPSIVGVLHVRVAHVHVVAITPPNANPLTLDVGQQTPLTAQLLTTGGQPFVWSLTFTATLTSSSSILCDHSLPNGGVGATASAVPSVSVTIPTDAQGKGTVFYTAPTNAPAGADCQGTVIAVAALSPSGIGGLDDPQLGTTWLANLTPATASSVVIISGDGQAASPGATLGQPLVVEVKDTFGNAVGGVPVTWSPTSGLISPMSLTTDAGGRLSAKWTLGTASGTQSVTASIPGGASVTFTASVS